MELSHRIESSVCVVTLDGDIGLEGAKDVRDYMAKVLEDETLTGVVMNGKNVQYINSAGFHLIISTFKQLQQRQGKLVLCELNEQNLELLSMTKLDQFIKHYPTEDEALESLLKLIN